MCVAAAAEKGIEITKSLIELAKIEGNLTKDITVYAVNASVCVDMWILKLKGHRIAASTSGTSGVCF
jgi:hypothetical protein